MDKHLKMNILLHLIKNDMHLKITGINIDPKVMSTKAI